MRALVIDDSRTVRQILSRILQEIGFQEVLTAEDGSDALKVLADHPGAPALALVDWNMPVMDGLQFVQAVRARPEYAEMKLLMVTTESSLDSIAKALESGADEYIMKPFTKEVIQDKLALLGIGEG